MKFFFYIFSCKFLHVLSCKMYNFLDNFLKNSLFCFQEQYELYKNTIRNTIFVNNQEMYAGFVFKLVFGFV